MKEKQQLREPDLLRLLRKNVAAMTPYSSARDDFSDRAEVWLDANENPFPTGYNRYPDPWQRKLKQAVAKKKNVPVQNIFVGNGSDEVLDLIFRSFCEPRLDNVVSVRPTYGMYEVLANTNDVQYRQADLRKDYRLDPETVLQLTDNNTKLILLCSPNNPTGNRFDTEDVISVLQNTRALVVLDEAYIDFSDSPGFLDRLEEFPHLVITQTLSKAYGMAALRLGMAFAHNAIIEILNRIKPPYNVNLLSQQEALRLLQDTEKTAWQIEIIKAEREKMRRELTLLPGVQKVFPSEANFLLVEMKNAAGIYQKLIRKGIVVRNRSGILFCPSCLRLTVGTPEENEMLLQALYEILKKEKNAGG